MKLKVLLLTIAMALVQRGIAQIKTVENSFYGCEPASFKFYTLGNTHSGQIWTDGNGNTSNKDTATFVFSTQGTYDVKIGGLTQTITIYPKLVYNFFTDSSLTGCFPFVFNLRDATSYPTGIFATKHTWTYENGGGKPGNPIKDTIKTYYKYNCFAIMNVETNVPSCNGNVTIPDYFKILDKPKAKISAIPSTSCKVPFTLVLNNLSKDSLKTDLNFLWKWSKPSPGTSTDSLPNSITYTTNLKDKITLDVTNKFGCKSYDTINVGIDTPSFDFTVPAKLCVNHPDSGTLVILNSEFSNFDYSINSTTFIVVRKVNDSSYKFIPNRRPTNKYTITVTKASKTDPTCKTSITKEIYLINDYPKPTIDQSSPCKTPISDTFRVRNVTKNVDSIIYKISYYDKYGVLVKDSFYGDSIGNTYKRSRNDSVLVHNILNYNDLDSFYRKGPLWITLDVTFINTETKCYMTDTFSAFKQSIFRTHIISDSNIGCTPVKNNFKVIRLGFDKIDSVTWVFGDNIVERTKGDSSRTHLYTTEGIYRAYAITKNTLGCIDTTNPLIIKRGDSTIPVLNISSKNLCISDPTFFSISNPSKFDKWYFVTDSFKSYHCPQESPVLYPHFYNIGKQYVYLLAEKNGCITSTKDSVYIDGPKYFLDYDFKCSRRDSLKFYLRDTFGIRTLFHTWDFGDGTVINSLADTMWHKYIGDSIDYKVKVTTTNILGCTFSDSTIVKIRRVKAKFTDSIYCKQFFPNEILNKTPYSVNPNQCRNADYLCNYRYTWAISSTSIPPVKYPPYTHGDKIDIHFPIDTMNMTLIARDANGCTDSMTKRIIVSDNSVDFILQNSGVCPPVAVLNLINLSSSIFGIKSYDWSVFTLKNGILGSPVLFIDTLKNPSFTVGTNQADSFLIKLTITDSANCSIKSMTKIFSFFIDTSHIILPPIICQNQADQIRSTENNLIKYKYKWYVNGVLTSDTLASFKYKFTTLGKYEVKLEKIHRATGCIRSFQDTTLVKPRPKIRIDNSFDTSTNKCFPAVTIIKYIDSLSIPGLGFYFEHNGNKTNLNPSNLSLLGGINPIRLIYWTDYGCIDTLINYDTVVKPQGTLIASKSMICKGDTIQFTIFNPNDIDTVHWVFGDGQENYGTSLSVKYNFPTANAITDTIKMSYIAYAIKKLCPIATNIPIIVLEARASHFLNDNKDTAFCFATVPIHNTSARADYYRWYYGDGTMDSSSQKIFNYNYKYPGKYTTRLYAYRRPLGCVDSSIHKIELFPKPELTAMHDTICFGKEFLVNYKDTLSNTKITLTPDFYKKNPYLSSPIKIRLTEPQDTAVILTSTSTDGCKDTFNVQLVILSRDTLLQLDTIIESGKRVIIPFVPNALYRYNWSPPLLNPSCTNCSYPELQVLIPTIYKLTMTDIRGCFTDTSHYFIDIYPDIKVVVPTAFTPNGDGNNDFIYARGFGIKRLISFKIFNRYGQLLFLTNDVNQGWDGYYKSILQNTDSYFYTYEAEAFIPKKIVSGEGNFMLLK
jgi:gliding motility-associated-like protein